MFLRKPKYNCKAAEYSLLFQPSGEILSCHYNRGNILGVYPQNSISEIWQGKKRKRLIKSIHSGKFNEGCYSCKLAIEEGLVHGAGFNKYNYINAENSKNPISMEFQLDNICNLECIMCSGEYSSQIRKNREKAEPYISPYDDSFVNQLERFIPFLKHAAFTGGEPFLFEIYYKIWDKIKILNPNLEIYVSTNGTVLNERIKEYLEDLNFNITISIDSLDKTNYEKIRKNAVLEKTLENVDYFNNYLNAKNKSLNIKCLVIPQNYKDIPDLIDYCNNNGINLIPKTVILPAFASFERSDNNELENIIKLLKTGIKLTETNDIINNNNNRFQEIIDQIQSVLLQKSNIDYTNLEDKSIDELKTILECKLIGVRNTVPDTKTVSFYKESLLLLYNSIEEEAKLKSSLIGFIQAPPEILIGEFSRLEIRKLIERFRQSSANF
ncbi:MAG: radical SAM protein [Bacteroidales bacterium]|nr:radical SAM protein [Bacteroidales bacterium]